MHDKTQLIYAAFITEGLHDAGYDKVLAAWGKGCIELIHEVVQYANFMDVMETAGRQAVQNYCGVYAYMVSSAFGWWFGKNVIETNEAPSAAACYAKIVDSTFHSFAKGLTEPQIDQLRKTLQTAAAAYEVATAK